MKKNTTTRKVVKESILDKVSMDEFTEMYGADVAKALKKYCDAMHKEPEEVLNGDDMEMTRFENWAKRKLKMDIYKNFGDYDYAKDLDKDAKSRMVDESSSMDPQYVIDWIAEELGDCEWCADFTFDDFEPTLEVETSDGDRFEISVTPIGRSANNDTIEDSWSDMM